MSKTEVFKWDVFLSHSSADKDVVRQIAERLKSDGIRVWFDEWEIEPGDSIPTKIEEGLEHSRVLLLFMSTVASTSEWATLESQSFRYQDPINRERRFIPIKLDNSEIKNSLAHFKYIDWVENPEQSYQQILSASSSKKREPIASNSESNSTTSGNVSKPISDRAISLGHTDGVNCVAISNDGKHAISGSSDNTLRIWDLQSGKAIKVLEGHTSTVNCVAISNDGKHAISGSYDNTLRIWDLQSGKAIKVLEGHTSLVLSVAISNDGKHAISGSSDNTLRIWDLQSGKAIKVLQGHTSTVRSVAIPNDGKHAISGSDDNTLRIWDLQSGKAIKVLEGHTSTVWSVAISNDGKHAISGSSDNTLRIWDLQSGKAIKVLEGHTSTVRCVAISNDGKHAISGSYDNTLRIWDLQSGKAIKVLEGHTSLVLSVAISNDGKHAISGSDDNTLRIWDLQSGKAIKVLQGHTSTVRSVAISNDGKHAISGSDDNTLRIWDLQSGKAIKVLQGHTSTVRSVAISNDGKHAISGSDDNTLRIWDLQSGKAIKVLEGHTSTVWSVAISNDGKHAISGSYDNTLRIWDLQSGKAIKVLEGHTSLVLSVAISNDGKHAISGSTDNTLRIWDLQSGKAIKVLEGHTSLVLSVAISNDGKHAISGSYDNTLRIWDLQSGKAIKVLEGHTGPVWSVAISNDGKHAISGSDDNTLRIWDLQSGKAIKVLEGHTGAVLSVAISNDGKSLYSASQNGVLRIWSLNSLAGDTAQAPEQVQYTNAKVLLVGNSSAGKTGLSHRLALGTFKESESTVGAWSTKLKLGDKEQGEITLRTVESSTVNLPTGFEREIWLWDFGGQADQRLIHQLYMDQTNVAALVFDPQKDDIFETIGQWDRDLSLADKGKPEDETMTKLLVAGRCDTGRLRIARKQIEDFVTERGFTDYIETSALTGEGCETLKTAIIDGIKWENIPWRSSPVLFKRIKDEIIALKDEGRVLMRFKDLREILALRIPGKSISFTDDELKAVISLLAGPGVVWELEFGTWVLLQPERINAYAQAVIQTIREDQYDRGCIYEEKVLKGELTFHSSVDRLPPDDERFVLLAMHKILLERSLCIRHMTNDGKILLIFPSYYRRERKEPISAPAVHVSYRFNGFIDEIYATLVVKLHHTQEFVHDELWRYAADFLTADKHHQLGLSLTRKAEGEAELELYFGRDVPTGQKIIFSKYVHEHLLSYANDVVRLRHYICPHCSTAVGNREVAMKKLEEGKKDIPCVNCDDLDKRVPLWDELEELFADEKTKQRVRDIREEVEIVLDNVSKERILVGEVTSTVAMAGQLCQEITQADHGIDMDVIFRTDDGHATGQKVHLQLKSGDSYLTKRKRDDVEIFKSFNERQVKFWIDQAFPVILVIRTSDGDMRWMEIRDYLKQLTNNGKNEISQFEFTGHRFDVMSVRRWRESALGQTDPALGASETKHSLQGTHKANSTITKE